MVHDAGCSNSVVQPGRFPCFNAATMTLCPHALRQNFRHRGADAQRMTHGRKDVARCGQACFVALLFSANVVYLPGRHHACLRCYSCFGHRTDSCPDRSSCRPARVSMRPCAPRFRRSPPRAVTGIGAVFDRLLESRRRQGEPLRSALETADGRPTSRKLFTMVTDCLAGSVATEAFHCTWWPSALVAGDWPCEGRRLASFANELRCQVAWARTAREAAHQSFCGVVREKGANGTLAERLRRRTGCAAILVSGCADISQLSSFFGRRLRPGDDGRRIAGLASAMAAEARPSITSSRSSRRSA